jgi:hypothetical protein
MHSLFGNEHAVKMPYLPRELQVKIVSHLDIDGRRALGIYGKLSLIIWWEVNPG